MSCGMHTWRRAKNSGQPEFGNASVRIVLRRFGRSASPWNLWQNRRTDQAIAEDQDITKIN
jgi:hypothetical protein